MEKLSSKQTANELRSILALLLDGEPSREVVAERLSKLTASVKVAYNTPAEDIGEAIKLLDYLPNGVARWVEAHGGNRDLANKNGRQLKKLVQELGSILASMPESVKYMVVGIPGSGPNDVIKFNSVDDMIRGLKRYDIEHVGFNRSPHVRPELRGQPTFSGLLGPMHGGGGWVRYETQDTYDALSI